MKLKKISDSDGVLLLEILFCVMLLSIVAAMVLHSFLVCGQLRRRVRDDTLAAIAAENRLAKALFVSLEQEGGQTSPP